jgi:hypothetical protein
MTERTNHTGSAPDPEQMLRQFAALGGTARG